jgi:hypothetical protein
MFDPEEILIFSPNTLVAWILLIAFSAGRGSPRFSSLMRYVLAATVVLTTINNGSFVVRAITSLQAWVAARPTL